MNAVTVIDKATGEVMDAHIARPPDAAFDFSAYIAAVSNTGAVQQQQQLAAAYDLACRSLIGPNDVQQEGNRTFKCKSAWRKLARYFGISVACDPKDVRVVPGVDNGDWLIYCSATATAPWGQSWSDVGACGSDEETGRRTLTYADAIATAMTRASNRAVSNLIAMGEVSADELSQKRTPNGSGEKRPRPTAKNASRSATSAESHGTGATPQRSTDTPRAGDVPYCPLCGEEMYDNRAKKASGEYKPNAPDFRCKYKPCDEKVWLDAKPAKAAASVPASGYDEPPWPEES